MTKIEPKTLKGFPDYAPKEQLARQRMFATIQSVFERFGFLPLSTPVLEYKEILMGKIGEDEKLIYSFKDNGERDVAMRYDLTVPLARFVAQNQNTITFPFKRYQIAPVWRAENTQKGRLREFYQCDIDVVGTTSPLADAEVMACICKALEALGIENYELRVNDRRIIAGMIKMLSIEDEKKIDTVIRIIDKKNKIGTPGVIGMLKKENLSEKALDKIKEYLDFQGGGSLGIPKGLKEDFFEINNDLLNIGAYIMNQGVGSDKFIYDFSIVRGLEYYTSTIFEVTLKDNPEFGSIAGGGRYDSLVDSFSDKSLSAVGGSIGIDRLFEALQSQGKIESGSEVKALVINEDQSLQDEYLKLVTELRDRGVSAELYYELAKVDKQFKYAENKGIVFAIRMDKTESAKNTVNVKKINIAEDPKPIEQKNLADYLLGNDKK